MARGRAAAGRGPGRAAPLVIGLLLVACGTPVGGSPSAQGSASAPPSSSAAASPSASAIVTLTADGCEYDGPMVLPSGSLAMELLNERGGQFDVDLWRLDEGHEYEKLTSHIAEEVRRADAGEPPLGHPSFADLVAEASALEGQGGRFEAALTPGTYGLACIFFREPERWGGMWPVGPIVVDEG